MDIVRIDILDQDKLESKHNVHTYEVFEVMRSTPRIRFSKRGHRKGEDVYAAFGQTEAGRYLAVVFVYKSSRTALVLSARDMDDKERRQYGRK
jgi:uncharacterized DUF497 family protein